MRRLSISLVACLTLAVPALAGEPITFKVAKQVDLGPVVEDKGAFDRWTRLATSAGSLLFFHVNTKRQIAYHQSRDGTTFAPAVTVCPGTMPAVALGAWDTIYLAYRNPRNRIGFRILRRTAPGKWDRSAKATEPLGPFCDGVAQFPSLLVPARSKRIWLMVNYQPVFLPNAPGQKGRPKPRTQPVLTYSDDDGRTWAPPVYVGSDSGDTGTGVVYLRSYRNRPAWFWAFWDCAPPAWGFHDGSRPRGLREFFPHTKYRTACHHAWDTLDAGGKLHFASGLDYQTRAQIYKSFDGTKWGPDVFLRGAFGQALLFEHSSRIFAAMLEGSCPHGNRIVLYEIAGNKAARRGEIFKMQPGRVMRRYYTLPVGRRPRGYVPLFLRTAKPVPFMVGKRRKLRFVEPRLLYLRLEPKAMDPAEAKKLAAEPLVDFSRIKDAKKKWFRDVPFDDTRIEPRTDPSYTRKIVRVGDKWIIVYADDNPGRMMAAEIKDGELGKPIALIDKRGWNRYRCSAAADGDGITVTEDDDRRATRVTGVGTWPKVDVKPAATPRARPLMFLAEPLVDDHHSMTTTGNRVDIIYTGGASYLGKKGIRHVAIVDRKSTKPVDVHAGDVIRGLSLCSLGGGRLLCVYCVRRPRPKTVPAGQERMKRFRYTLYYKIFDGKTWPKQPTPIKWPDVPVYRPKRWGTAHEVRGFIYIPETDLGRFPTLPERSHGRKKVPVAWMVPGFHCITRYWYEQDRGGLLVATEIDVTK